MVDFNNGKDSEQPRGSGGTSVASLQEFTRSDLAMVRSLAAQGLIDGPRMAGMTGQIAEIVENPDSPQRMRIAAFKALAALQVGMMKLLSDLHKLPADAAANVTNQQINIYLPSNGREATNGHLTNGHASNGRH